MQSDCLNWQDIVIWCVTCRRVKQAPARTAPLEEEEQMDEKLRISQVEDTQQTQPFYKNWCIW
jgi:hypothetical protein